MRRIRLALAPGLPVDFADRGAALREVRELAERGMALPWVVYSAEGNGRRRG